MNQYPILTTLGVIFIILAIIYLINPSFFNRLKSPLAFNGDTSNGDEDNKCEVRDANGNIISISSTSNSAMFERFCAQGPTTTPIFYNNNPFYFYRTWFPARYGRTWYYGA